jgi:hypothetical protein
MALPTAQLGSMASLNVPAYIPTTVVPKEPKAWEKALLALVTQAGSQVLSQGIQNSMQQDFASQNGETPTQGMAKFFQGPKVTRADNEARQQMLARMAGEIGLRELEGQPSARDVFAAREAEMRDVDNRTAQMQATRGQFALGREGHAVSRENARDDRQSRKDLAEAQRLFETPYQKAQIERLGAETGRLKADTDKERAQMELQKRFLQQQETAPDAKSGLTPRQMKVQTVAEGRKVPDTFSFPTTEAMPNTAFDPAVEKLASMVMGTNRDLGPNPHALRDEIVQLREDMAFQTEAQQATTARRIDKLLLQLRSISSGAQMGLVR